MNLRFKQNLQYVPVYVSTTTMGGGKGGGGLR